MAHDNESRQDPLPFFKAYDRDIKEEWEEYKKSTEFTIANSDEKDDKLEIILSHYRHEKTAYNWKTLPGANDGFSLLYAYVFAFEPNICVSRRKDVESFIEYIKRFPEKLWYYIQLYKEGSVKVEPKPGLKGRQPRSNQALAYIDYGGLPEYEGVEVDIYLSVNKQRELFPEESVHGTIAARYLNAYSGDWLNLETKTKRPGFENLLIEKTK